MTDRTAIKGHFEAKKHAYRQTQDGVVISFVVHPNDVSPALAAAALGTVFMLGYSEVVEGGEPQPEAKPEAKLPRHWDQLSPSQQAGIACHDPRFQKWAGCADAEGTAEVVRAYCGVESRAELDSHDPARARWRKLYADFRQQTGLETEMRF